MSELTGDRSSQAATNPEGRVVPMRLQKFLARAGVASRRGSEDLMTAGRVQVNGQVVTELGSKVDPRVDRVTVDGREVSLRDEAVTLVLNKPLNCLTTMDDPQHRPCVADLVPRKRFPGLFPIGRLDRNTTGLLLFSTDGAFGHQLLHPRFHVRKRYIAQIPEGIGAKELSQLAMGVRLSDGMTAPAEVELVSWDELPLSTATSSLDPARPHTQLLSLTISEGRKRQVRRMCEKVGHPLIALHRIAFGPISDPSLELGAFRLLTPAEVEALQALTRPDR